MINYNNYVLTNEEKAVLMGGLLGDEIIVRRGESYRYRVHHSLDQKEYVDWKRAKLSNICQTTQPPRQVPKKETPYILYEFYTSSGKYLKELHELFYKKNEKGQFKRTITQDLINSLPVDPLILAVWFLDDGSVRNDCYAGKIATQGFSREESELLCDYLRKFDVNCYAVKHTVKSQQWYITVPAHTFGNLMKLIEPFVKEIPSMEYKLNESRRTL